LRQKKTKFKQKSPSNKKNPNPTPKKIKKLMVFLAVLSEVYQMGLTGMTG